MDLVHPDLTAKIERHQQTWKDRSDQRACDRQFRVGEEVYVTAIPQSAQRWVPAVVTSVTGQSCEVRLMDGRVFRRHRSHMRTRYAPAPTVNLPSSQCQAPAPAAAPLLPQSPVWSPPPAPSAPPLSAPPQPLCAASSPPLIEFSAQPPTVSPSPPLLEVQPSPSPSRGGARGSSPSGITSALAVAPSPLTRPQRTRRAPARLDL